MSTRNTSSAIQRPQLGDKQKASGWSWPKLVRAEPQLSPASVQAEAALKGSEVPSHVESNHNPRPATSSTPAGKAEDVHSAQVSTSTPPDTASSTVNDHLETDPSTIEDLQEDNSPHPDGPETLERYTDLSSSRETSVRERPSTPSSPKMHPWEAAKKPQVHEPAVAYKSERTSVAEAARRLESIDQMSSPPANVRSPAVDQGFHSALPGVPHSLAQILGLPRPGKEPQSVGANPSHDEGPAPALESLQELPHNEPLSLSQDSSSTSQPLDKADDLVSGPNRASPDDRAAIQERDVPPLELAQNGVDAPVTERSRSKSPQSEEGLLQSKSQATQELQHEEAYTTGKDNPLDNSAHDKIRATNSEQSAPVEPSQSMLVAAEKTLDKPQIQGSDHDHSSIPHEEASTVDVKPPSADHPDETPTKRRYSFFHRLSRSEGHKTHAERKEEQKKEIAEQGASVADIVAEALQNISSANEPQQALSAAAAAAAKMQEVLTAEEVREGSGLDHQVSHPHTQGPPVHDYPDTLPPPNSEARNNDSLSTHSNSNQLPPKDIGSEDITTTAPELPPRNPQDSTMSNATLTPPLPPRSTPSQVLLGLGAPKIVIIRATDESCEALGPDSTASNDNSHREPYLPTLPPPAEDGDRSSVQTTSPSRLTHRSSGTGLLLEELGHLEVPVQGMIPRKTRMIRKGRCAVLRGPLLQMLLGRELARQTKPVLRLMAHGVEVQTDADGNMQLAQPGGVPTAPGAGEVGQDSGTSGEIRGSDAGRAPQTTRTVEGRHDFVSGHPAGRIAADEALARSASGTA